MPDDMLEEVIQVAKKALDEHEFEEEGVEVSGVFISESVTDLNFFSYHFQTDCLISGPMSGHLSVEISIEGFTCCSI